MSWDLPERVRAWVLDAAGAREGRIAAARLPNTSLSTLHAVEVVAPSGTALRLVLRRFTVQEWLDRVPGLPRREAGALTAMRGAGLRVPELVAVDEDGRSCDCPAVLMTRLDGSPDARPAEGSAFVGGLAEELARIHAAEPARPVGCPEYEPHHRGRELRMPEWVVRKDAWHEAELLYRQPPPAPANRLIHRDYHNDNVLWSNGEVSGVVDWVNACWGAAAADLGHCRFNLVLELGEDRADRFLDVYCRSSGYSRDDYDPYWDVAAAVGGVPDVPPRTPAAARNLERFVLRALDRSRRAA